ncbi:MAG: hypothetical protein U0105_05945 [Candidatus Obscuribacterales bacterium]
MEFDERTTVAENDEFASAYELAAKRFSEDEVKEGPPQTGTGAGDKTGTSEVSTGTDAKTPPSITNSGDIAKMQWPEKWVPEPEKSAYETLNHSTAFNPAAAGAKDARLVVNISKPNANPELEAAVRSICSKPHHELTQDEIKAIKQLLGPLGDPEVFNLKARTEELNGRTVLAVDGNFKTADRKLTGYLLTTANNEMQSVFFSAPAKIFDEYRPAADSAMQSIKWRGAPASKGATGEVK